MVCFLAYECRSAAQSLHHSSYFQALYLSLECRELLSVLCNYSFALISHKTHDFLLFLFFLEVTLLS